MSIRTDERGVSGILVAGSLLLLVGLAAIAVDLGLVFNERRGDQTSVDLGALAGGQSIINGTSEVVDDTLAYIRENLDTTYTNTEWQAAWQSCTDATPAGFVLLDEPAAWGTGTLQCMSFHPTGLFRVKLPDQVVETSFGKALGVNSISTGAEAVVRIRSRGTGGILPFGLLASAGGGDQLCLVDSSKGTAQPPCDGAASGNFGVLDAPHFGNSELGTTQKCTGDTNGRLNVNVALGLDHLVLPRNAAAYVQDVCPNIAAGTIPNQLLVQTGNSDVAAGFATGPVDYGATPRLQQGSNSKVNVHGYALDDKPLWEYLAPIGAFPADCDPATFNPALPDFDWDGDGTDDPPDSWQHMKECLDQYKAGGFNNVLFSEDIAESPRFSYVPQFEESAWPSGSSEWRTIGRYAAIWLEGTWWKKGNTFDAFHPGDGLNHAATGGNWDMTQLTGFFLGDKTLPHDLKGSSVAGAGKVSPFKPELYR